MITSSWKRDHGKAEIDLTVPPNCTATVYFPDEPGKIIQESSGFAKKIGVKEGYLLFEVPAGRYHFFH
jgi:alpha-L-rhamnosidase